VTCPDGLDTITAGTSVVCVRVVPEEVEMIVTAIEVSAVVGARSRFVEVITEPDGLVVVRVWGIITAMLVCVVNGLLVVTAFWVEDVVVATTSGLVVVVVVVLFSPNGPACLRNSSYLAAARIDVANGALEL